MKEKKTGKKSKWLIPLMTAVLVVAAVFVLIITVGNNASGEIKVTNEVITVDGIQVLKAEPYSGAYWEDGSDEQVENVMAVTVKNTGDTAVQLANLVVRDQNGNDYRFQCTSLWPDQTMIVLEQNRVTCNGVKEIAAAELEQVAYFAEEPTLCEDVLAISCVDHAITVKNVSGDTFQGGRVFYKNEVNGISLGGITYMVTVPALEKDEEITIPAGHYTVDGSHVLFVTYAQ